MLHRSLEDTLLGDYEYPIALTVEVTKQGVTLSKLRYLKTVGQMINETIRCPSIEVYCHVNHRMDPHIEKGHGRPMGIDWILQFKPNHTIFRDTISALREGTMSLNLGNPMTQNIAKKLMEKIHSRSSVSYKRLNSFEQGLVLEPYCRLAFERAGEGRRTVLQNVEIVDRESSLMTRNGRESTVYHPTPSPTMEIDLLVITEIETVHSILTGLKELSFNKNPAQI
ncbi:MAG: hypothetical protein KAT70_01580 [Thermoplasmata archaeon]|nr:hypothetical protein [Thermoplasmata archaeon]